MKFKVLENLGDFLCSILIFGIDDKVYALLLIIQRRNEKNHWQNSRWFHFFYYLIIADQKG